MDNPVHRRKLFRKIEEFQIESNKFLNFIENNEVPPLHGVSHVLRGNGFLSWELLAQIIHVEKDLNTVLDITNEEIVECLWTHLKEYKKDMTIPLPIKKNSHKIHTYAEAFRNNESNQSQVKNQSEEEIVPPAFKDSDSSSSMPIPSAPLLHNDKDANHEAGSTKLHEQLSEEEEFEGFYPIEGATTFQ